MKKSIYIYHHLGLGDSLICAGIVREYAKTYDLVVVPSKYHNLDSVNYMFRDLDNVAVRAVIDDEDATQFGNNVFRGEKLYLGQHGVPPFVAQRFDQEFYRQANLSFQLRWDNFKVARDPKVEVHREPTPDVFLHDDADRGMRIIMNTWPDIYSQALYKPDLRISRNIFAYLPILESVKEIHCINSSFALLVDSIDLPQNPKLYLHEYARPGGEVPTFTKNWTRFRTIELWNNYRLQHLS